MNESPHTQPPPSPDGPAVRSVVDDVRQALHATIAPFLEQAKQTALTAIDETIKKYSSGFLADTQQTLRAAVDEIVQTQVKSIAAQFAPTGDETRRMAKELLQELEAFIDKTVRELFETRLPKYSRRAGRSMIDYAVSGILFVLAAVLLCAGGVVGLQQVGVPPYLTFLIGGVVALGLGYVVLTLRVRPETEPPTATSPPPPATG
jgi:hypothetical protein